MSTTINTGSTTATGAAGASGATGAVQSASEQQDRFITLLVSQMKNQDPLNPMDNAQVTAQMAQISTVSGIDKLNETLKTAMTQFTGMQSLQSASLAGREVLTSGNSIELSNGTAKGAVEFASAVDAVTVKVYDGAGRLVHTDSLGPQAAGTTTFAWDGATDAGRKAADGAYTFTVEATQGGKAASATTLAYALVRGVVPAADGTQLDLGAAGLKTLSDIKRIQ